MNNANGQGGSSFEASKHCFFEKKQQKTLGLGYGRFDRLCRMRDGLADRKAAARADVIGVRDACDAALGAALTKHVLRDCLPKPGAIVAGFWPLPHEIDIRPLLHALDIMGFAVVLPVTPKRGEPLTFRRWKINAALLPGRYGTQHTDGPELNPDFILVPLLAFDNTGNRLGFGAGYYDRTFANLPQAFRLGCAFAAQEQGQIPVGPDDVGLDAIATETGVRRFLQAS